MARRHQGDLVLTAVTEGDGLHPSFAPASNRKGFNEGSPILIVDPDHSFSNHTVLLESLGCSTILSTTGADGLTQINRKGVYLDCVVTRMVLPNEGE